MKTHLDLTPSRLEVLRAAIKAQYDTNAHSIGASVFWNKDGETVETFPDEACYAPTSRRLIGQTSLYLDNKPFPNVWDSFGLVCQGYSGTPTTQGWGPEAVLWLGALMEPEGPFKDLLPKIANRDTVVEDGGFVFHNLQDVNLGLLWTFAQASRMMYEHPSRMPTFLYAQEKYGPRMGAFVAMNIAPNGPMGGDWRRAQPAHGEPLGQEGDRVAGRYLSAKPRATSATTGTSGSHECFLPEGARRAYPEGPSPRGSLETWVMKYQKEKEVFDGRVQPAAAA